MRYINFNGKEPSKEWLAKAKAVTVLLDAAGSKAERDKIIDDNSGVWGELKPWLLEFSNGKCWFSEARDVFNHWEVEHYRPKKVAKNFNSSKRADGYWWLAFDWRNFRICGNVGNRKKGGYFPLRDNTHQGTAENRNTDDEFPYLLDPTRPDDPLMLSFDENGDIKAQPDLDAWNTARVEESVKRYKLRGYEPLMEARRDIWARCTREINRCAVLMEELSTAPTATKKEEFRHQIEKLLGMVRFNAEFSAVAGECLRTRDERWARRLASESQPV